MMDNNYLVEILKPLLENIFPAIFIAFHFNNHKKAIQKSQKKILTTPGASLAELLNNIYKNLNRIDFSNFANHKYNNTY